MFRFFTPGGRNITRGLDLITTPSQNFSSTLVVKNMRTTTVKAKKQLIETLENRLEKAKAIMFRRKDRLLARSDSRTNAIKECRAAASLRRLSDRPWLAQGTLPTKATDIYVSANYALAAQPGEKPLSVIIRIRSEYKTLTAEGRAPYEEKAAANLRARDAARDKIKGLHLTPYFLFAKENFSRVSGGIDGPPSLAKGGAVARALSEQWKMLSAGARAEYKTRVDAIRAEAQANFDELSSRI